MVIGTPTIKSSIAPLSGGLCPGTVTFSCDSLETGSPILEWYINNTRIVRYEFHPSHTFPRAMSAAVAELMVQITQANITNMKYNYINFTLSANLKDLIRYQELFVTCGNIAARSNSILIGAYNIRGKIVME